MTDAREEKQVSQSGVSSRQIWGFVGMLLLFQTALSIAGRPLIGFLVTAVAAVMLVGSGLYKVILDD